MPAGRVNHGILSSIDILPTLAALCGGSVPADRIIDGVDASALLTGATDDSPRAEFYYYMKDRLEAVRQGDWKLHVWKKNVETPLLYNLRDDIGEQDNRAESEPEVVARLMAAAEGARENLGDEITGQVGNCRPIGRVPEGRMLTEYDPDHPYYMAEYDLAEWG